MATIYTQKYSNIRKTWLLMSCFLVVVIFIGWFIGYYYQSPFILYFAVIFSLLMNVISYWNSDKIVMSLSGGREIKKEDDRELFQIVENLSITAGLPMPRVYLIEDLAPNAFATGRDEKHSAIAMTTGLRKILDKAELEGVISHELSHIGNRDTLIATVVVVLVGLVSIMADFFLRTSHWGGRRNSDDNRGGSIIMVIGIVLVILSPIISTLIQLAISRKREFLADASGVLLTRYPEGLANALKKISSYNQPMQRVHSATAHLFIINPFGPKTPNFSKLFMTHPPVEDRIKALMGN
jgi:heat shock protein HtpX